MEMCIRDRDNHVVAHVLPHGHDRHRGHRPLARGNPADGLNAEDRQHVVDEAVVFVVQPAPDHAHGDGRGDVGQEEGRPVQGLSLIHI